MSAAFHPSETTLLDFVGGALNRGARLVVSAHLEVCSACRSDVGALEAAAGDLLVRMPSAQLDPHALELALARIERPEAPRAAPPPFASSALLEGVQVPAAIRRADIGAARWMAPGIRVAKLRNHAPVERLYLLRVGPGMRMPHHGHQGSELTLVLHGSFSDSGGRYRAGDLAEVCEDDVHTPTIDTGGDCVCLVAADGAMRMREWLPRMLQPLFGV